jgi:hypothetical protein
MLVAIVLLYSVPVWAETVTLDFTQGLSSNLGLSYAPDAYLTITAKSGLALGDDPLVVAFVADHVGTVYKGVLGNLGVAGKEVSFSGLGVQNAGGTDRHGKPTAPGGSKGISGDGGDQNEALIFTFADPPGVVAGSVKLNLVGLNTLGKAPDHLGLYLEFIPKESPSDTILTSISFFTTPTCLLDFGVLLGGEAHTFGSFAVVATTGRLGIAGIEYATATPSPVPLPTSVLLIGSGLMRLAAYSRRKRALA